MRGQNHTKIGKYLLLHAVADGPCTKKGFLTSSRDPKVELNRHQLLIPAFAPVRLLERASEFG